MLTLHALAIAACAHRQVKHFMSSDETAADSSKDEENPRDDVPQASHNK